MKIEVFKIMEFEDLPYHIPKVKTVLKHSFSEAQKYMRSAYSSREREEDNVLKDGDFTSFIDDSNAVLNIRTNDGIVTISWKIESEVIEASVGVDTPLGRLLVTVATDPLHPGLFIDLENKADLTQLTLIEYSNDEGDFEGEEKIITRVWKNRKDDEYTHRVVHNLTSNDSGETI